MVSIQIICCCFLLFSQMISGPSPLSNKQIARRAVLFILVTILWIYQIYRLGKEMPRIYIPHSIEDVKVLSNAIGEYNRTKHIEMLTLFTLVFLFKQTYCIPGAALLNILAGSLFGTAKGLVLVMFLTSLGSSFTFLLSKHFLGTFIFGRLISESRLASLRSRVEANRKNLLYFIISLRMVPLVPGGVTNIASPFLKIPLDTFFFGTFIGVAPYGFLCVSAASTLSSINSVADIFNLWTILKLLGLIGLVILTILNKKRIFAFLGMQDMEFDGREDSKDKPLPV